MPAPVLIQNSPFERVAVPGTSHAPLSIGDTVATLPTLNSKTKIVSVQAQGGNVLYTLTGTTPAVGGAGFQIFDGQEYQFNASNWATLKLIREAEAETQIQIQEYMYAADASRRASELRTATKTTPFLELVKRIPWAIEHDSDTWLTNASADKKNRIAAMIEDGVRLIWEAEFWHLTTITEERDTVQTDGGRTYFPYAGAGLIAIGEVMAVHLEDPRESASPRQLAFRIENDAVTIIPGQADDIESVFVTYALPAPRFTFTAYAGGTEYAAGDVVYYADGGSADCYMALQTTTGHAPTDTVYWEKQSIPRDFALYAQYHAEAMWARADGRSKEWPVTMRLASAELVRVKQVIKHAQRAHDGIRYEVG